MLSSAVIFRRCAALSVSAFLLALPAQSWAGSKREDTQKARTKKESAPASRTVATAAKAPPVRDRTQAIEEYRSRYVWFESKTRLVATSVYSADRTDTVVDQVTDSYAWQGVQKEPFKSDRDFFEHVNQKEVIETQAQQANKRLAYEQKAVPFNVAGFAGFGLIGLGAMAFTAIITPGALLGLGGGVLGKVLAFGPLAVLGAGAGVILLVAAVCIGGALAAAGAGLVAFKMLSAPKEVPHAQWPGMDERKVMAHDFNKELKKELDLTDDEVADLPHGN